MIQCQSPDRFRWGKSPPDYRGLRKTWVVEDLARKNRKQIKATENIVTALPALGISGVAAEKVAGGQGRRSGRFRRRRCSARRRQREEQLWVPGARERGQRRLLAVPRALGPRGSLPYSAGVAGAERTSRQPEGRGVVSSIGPSVPDRGPWQRTSSASSEACKQAHFE